MALERIKARAGWIEDSQRYPDTEDFTPPEQVEDPHTIEDDTQETVLDKLLANRWWATVRLAVHARRADPRRDLLRPVLRDRAGEPVGAALRRRRRLVGGARRWGRSSERAQLENEHELTLYDPDDGEAIHFTGRYRRVDGATHDTFIPFKGRRRGSGEPYRVGELSSSMVKQHNRDPDEPAEIRLQESLVSTRQTERGLKVTQLTSGLKPDPFGKESNLVAKIPSLAATDTVSDLKKELEKQDEELQDLREKNDQLRRQRDNARSEARKNYDEVRREIKKDADMLEPFVRPSRSRSGAGRRRERPRPPRSEARRNPQRRRLLTHHVLETHPFTSDCCVGRRPRAAVEQRTRPGSRRASGRPNC